MLKKQKLNACKFFRNLKIAKCKTFRIAKLNTHEVLYLQSTIKTPTLFRKVYRSEEFLQIQNVFLKKHPLHKVFLIYCCCLIRSLFSYPKTPQIG